MMRRALLFVLLAAVALLECQCATTGSGSSKGGAFGKQLFLAAEAGNLSKVRSLLAQGANVNSRGDQGLMAIHCAAYNNDIKMATLLISKGADVNAKSFAGKTPLFFATDPKMTALLKEHGAR